MLVNCEGIFVFVVCGGKEHIDTLHFSLRAIKQYSKCKVLVVTDSTRNEIPVNHTWIVDIKTPVEYDHHQASIYLKTGLHRFLPSGNLYCYLDTDVVALNEEVDSIFKHFIGPVTFATDHCRINAFSPFAVNCNCYSKFTADNTLLHDTLKKCDESVLPLIDYIDNCNAEINALVEETKKNKGGYFLRILKYHLPGDYYVLNNKYKLHKKSGRWYDKAGLQLWYAHKDNIRFVEENTGFVYDKASKRWGRKDGSSLEQLTCNHLAEAISDKYSIAITPPDWQHWNGGVFLFSDLSHNFLQHWHTETLKAFDDPYWKTRDQGTLAATVWLFGLQSQPTLPIRYNFIADYNSEKLKYLGGFKFAFTGYEEVTAPCFVHIYHHWGDTDWDLWNDVKVLIDSF